MGQKVNPIGFRVGIYRPWDSRWYAGRDYGELLAGDLRLRAYIEKKLAAAGVAKIIIERLGKKPRLSIHVARPGVVIGRKGSEIDTLRKELTKVAGEDVTINLVEVRKPELEAKLLAESVAQQLERRVAFRRAMKRAVQSAMRLGAQGIRINCGGRLGGAEIARMEWYREGRVPLHTLRADIDYAQARATTTYGICGVKVWIYKGDVLESAEDQAFPQMRPEPRPDNREPRENREGRGRRGRNSEDKA
jgi:small subunit ribosomal protein S3